MARSARLLVGNTDQVPNLTYATGLFVPDSFAWFQTPQGKTHLLLSPLEIDRARRQATVDHCHDLSVEEKRFPKKKPEYATILASLLRRHGIRSAQVPADFPLRLARSLTDAGLTLHPIAEPFFPSRIKKDSTGNRPYYPVDSCGRSWPRPSRGSPASQQDSKKQNPLLV